MNVKNSLFCLWIRPPKTKKKRIHWVSAGFNSLIFHLAASVTRMVTSSSPGYF